MKKAPVQRGIRRALVRIFWLCIKNTAWMRQILYILAQENKALRAKKSPTGGGGAKTH
jgi:hypothetical protein